MFLYESGYDKHAKKVFQNEMDTMTYLRDNLFSPYNLSDNEYYECWAFIYPLCHLAKFVVNLCKLIMTTFNLLLSIANKDERDEAFEIWTNTFGALSLNIVNCLMSFVAIFTRGFATLAHDYFKDPNPKTDDKYIKLYTLDILGTAKRPNFLETSLDQGTSCLNRFLGSTT